MWWHVEKPWLCRWGFHSWRLTHMHNVRLITAGVSSELVCEAREICRRRGCSVSRYRSYAKVPKRVRT